MPPSAKQWGGYFSVNTPSKISGGISTLQQVRPPLPFTAWIVWHSTRREVSTNSVRLSLSYPWVASARFDPKSILHLKISKAPAHLLPLGFDHQTARSDLRVVERLPDRIDWPGGHGCLLKCRKKVCRSPSLKRPL